MNLKLLSVVSLFTLVLTTATVSVAQPTDAEVIAKARESYPLKACIVSDEAITNLNDAIAYIHRAPGKPDRVVFFCCEGCTDDFKGDPQKYLKKLDAAADKSKETDGKKSGKKNKKSDSQK